MFRYKKCPDCGLEIPKNTNVCPYCAKPLFTKIYSPMNR